MLFLVVLPIIIGLACQLVLSTSPMNQTLAVVSEEFTNGLADCDRPLDFNCTHSGRPLSCRYIDFLEATSLKFVSSHHVNN